MVDFAGQSKSNLCPKKEPQKAVDALITHEIIYSLCQVLGAVTRHDLYRSSRQTLKSQAQFFRCFVRRSLQEVARLYSYDVEVRLELRYKMCRLTAFLAYASEIGTSFW